MGIVRQLSGNITAWRKTRTVTVAVTGLSGSGKTAFITSVVAGLEAAGRNSAAARWLNGFDLVDTARLCSAEQPPDYRPIHGRLFPLADMLAALTADTPRWPSRTACPSSNALRRRGRLANGGSGPSGN
jgi:predicted YcjX-like family ATPase